MPKASVLQTVIQPKPQPLPETGSALHLATALLEEEILGNDPAEMDAMLAVLVENVPVAMAMFDCRLRYLLANRQWITDFGLQEEVPLVGRSQFEVFPNLHPGWRSVYDRALQGHVVRSENDVTEGPDGLPMIFRWEVRPWRRRSDSQVGGVMVTCEKFSFPGLPETQPQSAPTSTPAAETSEFPTATPVTANSAFVDCDLPMLLVDDAGVIQRANDASQRLLLSRGLHEGASHFWDLFFGTGHTATQLRTETLEAIGRSLAGETHELVSLKVRPPGGPSGQFMLWALSRSDTKSAKPNVLLVGIKGEDPTPTPPPAPAAALNASTTALEAAFHLEKRHLEDQIASASNELKLLRDMEQAFKRRELRQREVLDTMPCGLIVLDERGRPTFHNAHVRDLFGQELKPGDAVEDWLMHACLNDAHCEEVSRIWREHIWRRQLTKVVSLSTADGLLKDFEFRPAPLPNNGLLLTIHDVTDTCRLEEMLRSTEAKFRAILHEAPCAIVLTDPMGAIFEVNAAAERLLAHPKAELRRTSIDDWLTSESVQERRTEVQRLARGNQSHAVMDVAVRSGKTDEKPASLKVAAIYDAESKLHSTAHFLELPRYEAPPAAAAPAETVASAASNSAPTNPADDAAATEQPEAFVSEWQPILQTSSQGRIQTWSDDAATLFGWSEAEAQQRWLHQLFKPSDATGFYSELQTRLDQPGQDFESAWYGKDGKRGSQTFRIQWSEDADHVDLLVHHQVPAPAAHKPQPPAASASASLEAINVTSQKGAWWPEADLDRERLMLTETHHRITNHLQLISSLLNLQSNTIDDEAARQALRSSQNRVRAIAVLHQHLYTLAMGQAGSWQEFVTGLVDHLRECFGISTEKVSVTLNMEDAHIRDEWVMPLALILNEAISNAFKHAFPGDRSGKVEIQLLLGSAEAHLSVTDNGVGLPPGFDAGLSLGLGLKVIGVFAEQMRGLVSLKNIEGIGFRFNLQFPIACVDN